MVTSIQTRIDPRSYFLAASVDPTEARNDVAAQVDVEPVAQLAADSA
jgi:hypothetical protein